MNDGRVHFGCQIVSYGDVEGTIRYSLLAERNGFDTVTLPDHLFHPSMRGFLERPPWEVFTVAAAIGSTTRKIRIMPAVADPVRRHPTLLAHTIATLDRLTVGRAMLGLGAGEAFNILPLRDVRWDRPYTRLKEAITLTKMLWTSTKEEPAVFRGEYFEVKRAFLSLKPIQKPHPPIYIGGYGPRLRRLVATEANGWIPWMHAPELYKHDLELIIETAKKIGRDLEEIDPAVLVMTVILLDPEEALRVVHRKVKIGLALRTPLLRKLGYSDLADDDLNIWKLADDDLNIWKLAFTEEQIRRLLDVSDHIPVEAVERVTVTGSADDAIDQIGRYFDAGVRHFIAIPLIDRFEETVKAYGGRIIPYFREEYPS